MVHEVEEANLLDRWFTINQIGKELSIPESTVRRYQKKFSEHIENKGIVIDGLKKYPESILRVVQQIYRLFQEGKRTNEIRAILDRENKAVIQIQEQQEITYQAFTVSAMSEIIQQNTKAMQEVAAALGDINRLHKRIENQDKEIGSLRHELQEVKMSNRLEKDRWYKKIFGKK